MLAECAKILSVHTRMLPEGAALAPLQCMVAFGVNFWVAVNSPCHTNDKRLFCQPFDGFLDRSDVL